MYKKLMPESKPLNYYFVESISVFLIKVEKLGGKVTQLTQIVPGVGWIASAKDPEGNLFTLFQPIAWLADYSGCLSGFFAFFGC